jgi:hypothetical protein
MSGILIALTDIILTAAAASFQETSLVARLARTSRPTPSRSKDGRATESRTQWSET